MHTIPNTQIPVRRHNTRCRLPHSRFISDFFIYWKIAGNICSVTGISTLNSSVPLRCACNSTTREQIKLFTGFCKYNMNRHMGIMIWPMVGETRAHLAHEYKMCIVCPSSLPFVTYKLRHIVIGQPASQPGLHRVHLNLHPEVNQFNQAKWSRRHQHLVSTSVRCLTPAGGF